MASAYTLYYEPSSLDRGKAVSAYWAMMAVRRAGGDFLRNIKRPAPELFKDALSSFTAKAVSYKLAYRALFRNAPIYRVRSTRRYPLLENATYQSNGMDARRDALVTLVNRLRRERRFISDTTGDLLSSRTPARLLVRYQSTLLSRPKRPRDDAAEYVGIEIECILPSGQSMTPLMPYARWIDIGGDGSISYHEGEMGKEIRVCIKRDELRAVIPGIIGALNEMGARVNTSCGLHVHLDQRHNPKPEETQAKLVRSLGLLYTVVPASRRNNAYCKRNRRDSLRAKSRYRAINGLSYFRHKTIEVRLFAGTLNATKIINWVETLLAIAHGAIVLRCPQNFDTARKHWPLLSDENVAWLKARQAQFGALNSAVPEETENVEAA